MNKNDIEVSIVCLAYNHEKYIRDALEGFVNQNTNFNYEVIIHDDASTDGTAKIISEYAARYPDLIVPIFQTENQYSKHNPIHANYTAPIVRGKYIAMCEGDDFWVNPNKLQRQYEVMEEKSDCSICTHIVQDAQENGIPMGKYHPPMELSEGIYGVQDFLKIQRKYPFQTSSYFMRSELWKSLMIDPPEFRKVVDVGDEPMLLYMLAHGNLYFIPECMSMYRRFAIGSWSQRTSKDKKVIHAQKMYKMMCLYDEYTEHKYDCNIVMFRGRMLLMKKAFSELVKKENKAYLDQLKFHKRIYVYACSVFPFLGNFMK